jgi:hypothetical protein
VSAVSDRGLESSRSNQVQITVDSPPPALPPSPALSPSVPNTAAPTLVPTSNPNPPAIVPSGASINLGPVGHWKFDEGLGQFALDSSGSGINGFLNGPTWTAGVFGGGLRFDGIDDYINLGNPAALNFGMGSFTYSLWVNISQNVTPISIPLSKGGSSAYSPGFNIQLGTGPWTANIADGVGTVNVTFGHETLYQWVLLTAVIDRLNNQFRAYKNGVLVSVAKLDGIGSVTGPQSFRIGSSDSGYSFRGTLDDVRVYDRALSPSQILELYGTGLMFSGTGH